MSHFHSDKFVTTIPDLDCICLDQKSPKKPKKARSFTQFYFSLTQHKLPKEDRPLQAVPDENELLKLVDCLIFEKTGKHLNTLQQLVFQGMYDGKTYEAIAQDTRYTTKYVREVGYKLLKTLSVVMDEDMQKGNLKAACDRRNISNNSNFGRDYIQYIQSVEYVHTLNLNPSLSSPSNSDNNQPTESRFKTQIERLEIDVADVVCKLHNQGIQPCQIAQLLGLPDGVIETILRELSWHSRR